MSKIKEFINTLNRSTRITLLSCLCFVFLTLLILTFFILFPITPSEKIMASIGRENIFSGNDGDPASTVTPTVVTTTADASSTAPRTSYTKPVTTTTKTYKIVITTGSGFSQNGRIPTGFTGYENTVTTPAYDDPPVTTGPYDDPGYLPPVSSIPPNDPNSGDVPGGSDVPPSTEPSVPPVADDPPTVDPPVEDGGTGGGDVDIPADTE